MSETVTPQKFAVGGQYVGKITFAAAFAQVRVITAYRRHHIAAYPCGMSGVEIVCGNRFVGQQALVVNFRLFGIVGQQVAPGEGTQGVIAVVRQKVGFACRRVCRRVVLQLQMAFEDVQQQTCVFGQCLLCLAIVAESFLRLSEQAVARAQILERPCVVVAEQQRFLVGLGGLFVTFVALQAVTGFLQDGGCGRHVGVKVPRKTVGTLVEGQVCQPE